MLYIYLERIIPFDFEVYLRMHLLINQCLYQPIKKRAHVVHI